VIKKSNFVVYYEVMTSMSKAAVFKFTPAFTWARACCIETMCIRRQFNKWRSQSGGVRTLRTWDTSDPRHFGTGAEISWDRSGSNFFVGAGHKWTLRH